MNNTDSTGLDTETRCCWVVMSMRCLVFRTKGVSHRLIWVQPCIYFPPPQSYDYLFVPSPGKPGMSRKTFRSVSRVPSSASTVTHFRATSWDRAFSALSSNALNTGPARPRSGSQLSGSQSEGVETRRPRSRALSQSSNSRSLTVNEREAIRIRDQLCLFCGVAVANEVAHILPRSYQADPEVSLGCILCCPTHPLFIMDPYRWAGCKNSWAKQVSLK